MQITSVHKNNKNNKRVSIYVDDQYAFSIQEEDYLRLGLYEKKELTQDEIDYINNSINFKSAKFAAIKYLSYKLRSEMEVRTRLSSLDYDSDIVNQTIKELKSMGYINDVMFVQKYIYDRSKLKPQSKKMLKYDLKSKGIPEEIIDQILDNWEMDEVSIAAGLIKRKFGKYDIFSQKILKRVQFFLFHRGFSYETIMEALRSLMTK